MVLPVHFSGPGFYTPDSLVYSQWQLDSAGIQPGSVKGVFPCRLAPPSHGRKGAMYSADLADGDFLSLSP